MFYYVIGIAASIGLRKKHPELARPFKAPGIMIGAPISVIIYILMMTQLDKNALITGVIWCVLGLIFYAICQAKYKSNNTADIDRAVMAQEVPGDPEKRKMDKEFKIWAIVVGCAVVIVMLLYIIPFFVV